jgi:hypothetical protein
MTDSTDQQQAQPAKTGDAAWQEQKRSISDRNDEARKNGKAERTAREQRQKAALRQEERNGIYR